MLYKSENYDLNRMQDRIRQRAEEKDITLVELQKMLGLSSGYLYTMLNQNRNIAIGTIAKLADILDVSIDWLCGYGTWEER